MSETTYTKEQLETWAAISDWIEIYSQRAELSRQLLDERDAVYERLARIEAEATNQLSELSSLRTELSQAKAESDEQANEVHEIWTSSIVGLCEVLHINPPDLDPGETDEETIGGIVGMLSESLLSELTQLRRVREAANAARMLLAYLYFNEAHRSWMIEPLELKKDNVLTVIAVKKLLDDTLDGSALSTPAKGTVSE